MTFEELVDTLKKYGVVGAGGAGFPSYAKLNKNADTVILNCAECEPLLKLHRQVLEKYSYEILSTLDKISKIIGANDVYVAVKASYKDTIESVNSNLDSFKNIKIKLLPEIYPAGDEIITIYETTGRRVKPGDIPISVGVIVFNVETVLNIHKAFNSIPVTEKYITVAGEVKNPVTVKVPLGVTFKEVINLAGGSVIDDYSIISGGPMTGVIAGNYDTVKKTTNAILVLPKGHKIILKKNSNVSIDKKRIMSACCQCRMCTDLCSRNLLGHPIEPHMIMRKVNSDYTFSDAQINSVYCSGCGICEMYACMQGLSPRKIINILKTKVKNEKISVSKPEFENVNTERDFRRVPMERLIQRLGLLRYDAPAPLVESNHKVSSVKIHLSQSIGKAPLLTVNKGDKVSVGDIIGKADRNSLSVNLHSSVDGVVREVNESFVIIDC